MPFRLFGRNSNKMNVHCLPISITKVELFFPVNGDVVEVFANVATITSELAARQKVGASMITELIFKENPNFSDCVNANALRKLKAAAKAFNKAFFAKWVSDDAEFVEAFGRINGTSHHVLMEV